MSAIARGPAFEPALRASDNGDPGASIAPSPAQGEPRKGSGAVAVLLAALVTGALSVGLDATLDTPRTLMSASDYGMQRAAIDADTRTALGRCRGIDAAQRNLCRAEAHARDRIAKAELDERYYGTVQAARTARDVRLRALAQLARARCAANPDADRERCLEAAGADQPKAGAGLPLASS